MNIRSSHRVKGCGIFLSQERGAALIVALSVFLVLLSLAITFSIIVRYETQMTTSAVSRAQAERMLDGAVAQAQYRLNRDLNLSPDAMSLDHGWRSWFNGAAFVGKNWTQAFQGEKRDSPLYRGTEGLISVNLESVEAYLRARGVLEGVLYVHFTDDGHCEPLFRGPRTESWLNVPRHMGNDILLFDNESPMRLMKSAGEFVALPDLNNALAQGNRPERFHFWSEVDNPDAYPFVVPDEGTVKMESNDVILTALPQERVNHWADVDSTGDGMRDSIWLPVAREVNHFGDGIDNMLSGTPDPARYGGDGEFDPLFESAPFVYHGHGLPEAARSENLYELSQIKNQHWADRLDPNSYGDGYDNDNSGGVDNSGIDDDAENKLFLTVPLPNLMMQVDLNNDGLFDERDYYEYEGVRGPLYVKLPPQIHVTVIVGENAAGHPIWDSVPLDITDVDTLDNDYDLVVNNFRTYAYVGPHRQVSAVEDTYKRYRIPYSEGEYTSWLPFQDPADASRGWHGDDKKRPVFAGAHNRGYHDISVDAALGGPDALKFFVMSGQPKEIVNDNDPIRRIFRQRNAIHITCSGEPVSEIIGRYAVHIDDESGKVDLNTAGAYMQDPDTGAEKRSLHLGRTTFEYDSRLLPKMGEGFIRQFWHFRTSDPSVSGDYFGDGLRPGYGMVDDNGNALLLALSGWDEDGRRIDRVGLHLPKTSDFALSEMANSGTSPLPPGLARVEDNGLRFRERVALLGHFEGIDEPSELQLYNPLKTDRLFLRKEDLRLQSGIGVNLWEYLRNLVTANSEKRNSFHLHSHDQAEAFHQLDPNTATPQQLAATLILKTEMGNSATGIGNNRYQSFFSEGLRQFDTAFIGDIMGASSKSFPADPLLQLMRLATDIAVARTPQLGIRRLSTDNVIRNQRIYRNYIDSFEFNNLPSATYPREPLNERERIAESELFPTGDIQEFIEASADTSNDKRVISPDMWWKEQTGEERLIQYTAASLDAIRINEIMVRPVRRVEAEMEVSPPADDPENFNLVPAPVAGMLDFYLERDWPHPDWNPMKWVLRSAYDDLLNNVPQPLLGDRTSWVCEPVLPLTDADLMEFRFLASDGLPAGRYYLTANFTDQYGRMTVNDVDVLQYAIKYVLPGGRGIADDFNLAHDLMLFFESIGLSEVSEAISKLMHHSFQSLDEPEFFATEAMLQQGSASAVGWAFLPHRGVYYDFLNEEQDFGSALVDYLTNHGLTLPNSFLSDELFQLYLIPHFWSLMGGALGEEPLNWTGLIPPPAPVLPLDPLDPLALDYAWFQLLGLLDSMYNSAAIGYHYDGTGAHTVLVPPVVYGEFGEPTEPVLSVAVRMNPRLRDEYAALLDDYMNGFSSELPQPLSMGDYQHVLALINNGLLLVDPDTLIQPLPLAVNFFDFSQEPSHEYLELANVSDEEVDLSGWILEVGIPDPPGVTHDPMMSDPYKSRWRIPDGTKIAAQGYLLLGINQGPAELLAANGMGLFSASDDPLEITVPPIGNTFTVDPDDFPGLYDETGSVFYRLDGKDYIDNDGDGLSSQNLWDINVALSLEELEARDTDHVLSEIRTHGLFNDDRGIPARARIVPLRNEQLWKEYNDPHPGAAPSKMEEYLYRLNPYRPNAMPVSFDKMTLTSESSQEGLKYLARFLLRGGMFPNYPERDGIDNDGDGAYVVSNPMKGFVRVPGGIEQDLLSFVPGSLDKDMVDNNLDGVMDQRGYERLSLDQSLPLIARPGDAYDSHGNPLISEGVDEGRLGYPVWYPDVGTLIPSAHRGFLPTVSGLPRFFGPGSYEATPLSLFKLDSPPATAAYREWASIVSTGPQSVSELGTAPDPFEGFDPAGLFPYNQEFFPVVNPDSDSPDWLAFVERRWNPGDNVIVTLYVGHPSHGLIADQVSYNELDVINRTKDDIVDCPYRIPGFSNYGFNIDGNLEWLGPLGDRDDIANIVCMAPGDPGRHSFWLPDHMGLDFYRSLERKHPFYHGDRFGLANRWTATDGIYDDWAESMSRFETGLGFMPTGPNSANLAKRSGRQATDGASLVNHRFENKPDAVFTDHASQLYGHAFWGSPLRMNTQARHWENPPDLMQWEFGLKRWLDPEYEYPVADDSNASPRIRNQRYRRQFAGLDAYRNTGHALRLNDTPAQDGSRRLSTDWAVRRAKLRKKPFATLGDLVEQPLFSFEKLVEGPSRYLPPDDLFYPLYTPQYAVSVLNTHYYSTESKVHPNENFLPYGHILDRHCYGVDRDLTSALLGQAVYGGGGSLYPAKPLEDNFPTVVSDVMSISAMNPKVLTVGQAQTIPLWPAPGALDWESGSEMNHERLRGLFEWRDDLPPYMWTPVYFCNLPQGGDWHGEEWPWQKFRYPRMVGVDGTGQTVTFPEEELLYSGIEPVYLFNGQLMGMRMTGKRANQIDEMTNEFTLNRYAEKWPLRREASIVGGHTGTDRASMYVSRAIPEYGLGNRPEVLFVWDRETGLENGEYIAYVGTFIPGMKEKMERAQDVLRQIWGSDLPSLRYDGPTRDRTTTILNLDPTHTDKIKSRLGERFAPRLALEFITDRRAGSQMYMAGHRSDSEPAMTHPDDWLTGPGQVSGAIYTPDSQGYIFYSDNPSVAWRPIPVRVEDNYLALRVRNMGNENEIACITHVVLAPAPRTHGVININTTETKQVVEGETSPNNWTIELFNALFGLPGVVNALNVEKDSARAPYLNAALGLPSATIPKAEERDPWRRRWQTDEEKAFLNDLGPLPPPVRENITAPLLTSAERDEGITGAWEEGEEGRAMLRLSSLIAGGRPHHADGRYYEDISDLLRGSYAGGIAYRDGADGPWPLSNLGLTDSFAVMGNAGQIASRYQHQFERRHDEIVQRFSQMANLVTTRSNVFEIIATVQVGSVIDSDGDGVLDYRGDEFFPQAEARGRVIYDLHSRSVFQDEYRSQSPQ
ncbi:MAG: lamin tail domain-containing protein [Candidatus Hydrogenedens sp.]|nr:lamin tail domain-containing protein [Candidatus Hydrogenedens sp.]